MSSAPPLSGVKAGAHSACRPPGPMLGSRRREELHATQRMGRNMPSLHSGTRSKLKSVCVLGLDLAGSPRRPTGFCALRGRRVNVGHLFSDGEIVETVQMERPQLIAIDAPLALPAGRCCLLNTCICAGTSHFRVSDYELRRIGIRFFPMTLGPMRQLTQRGMQLKSAFEDRGFAVIETYPGAAQDIWGIPRQRDVAGLRRGLSRFRLQGLSRSEPSPHVLDAVTCALVGRLYLEGNAWGIGSADEALMFLPPLPASNPGGVAWKMHYG
jgi:predicted nuclease with RNAse H fold